MNNYLKIRQQFLNIVNNFDSILLLLNSNNDLHQNEKILNTIKNIKILFQKINKKLESIKINEVNCEFSDLINSNDQLETKHSNSIIEYFLNNFDILPCESANKLVTDDSILYNSKNFFIKSDESENSASTFPIEINTSAQKNIDWIDKYLLQLWNIDCDIPQNKLLDIEIIVYNMLEKTNINSINIIMDFIYSQMFISNSQIINIFFKNPLFNRYITANKLYNAYINYLTMFKQDPIPKQFNIFLKSLKNLAKKKLDCFGFGKNSLKNLINIKKNNNFENYTNIIKIFELLIEYNLWSDDNKFYNTSLPFLRLSETPGEFFQAEIKI